MFVTRSGRIQCWPEASREAIRQSNRRRSGEKRILSQAAIANIQRAAKRPERIARILATKCSNGSNHHTEQTKAKLAEIMRTRWKNPALRRRFAEASRQKFHNAELLERYRQRARQLFIFLWNHERAMMLATHARGPNNGRWKGGRAARRRIEFGKLRPYIFDRDGPRCVLCGTGTVKLCVHHIDHNPQNNRLRNLVVLCIACNTKAEARNLELQIRETLSDYVELAEHS